MIICARFLALRAGIVLCGVFEEILALYLRIHSDFRQNSRVDKNLLTSGSVPPVPNFIQIRYAEHQMRNCGSVDARTPRLLLHSENIGTGLLLKHTVVGDASRHH